MTHVQKCVLFVTHAIDPQDLFLYFGKIEYFEQMRTDQSKQ